jgi:hypothetical protein
MRPVMIIPAWTEKGIIPPVFEQNKAVFLLL